VLFNGEKLTVLRMKKPCPLAQLKYKWVPTNRQGKCWGNPPRRLKGNFGEGIPLSAGVISNCKREEGDLTNLSSLAYAPL